MGGPGTTKSRDMTLDWSPLTSSEMSVLHASFVYWPIPRWKWLSPTMGESWSGTTWTINFGRLLCDLYLWIDALLHSLWETKIFRKSQIEALWCPESVQSSAICDRFVYWRQFECNGISGPELVCGSSRDHKNLRYDIRLMTSHFFRNVSFAC